MITFAAILWIVSIGISVSNLESQVVNLLANATDLSFLGPTWAHCIPAANQYPSSRMSLWGQLRPQRQQCSTSQQLHEVLSLHLNESKAQHSRTSALHLTTISPVVTPFKRVCRAARVGLPQPGP